jgi:hypothetical protein
MEKMRARYPIIAIFIAVLIVIGIFTIPSGRDIPFTWDVEEDDTTLSLNYEIGDTSYSKIVNVLVQGTERPWDMNITILIDTSPWISGKKLNGSFAANVQGLYDHLKTEFEKSGVEVNIEIIEEDGLTRFFENGPSTLIIANDFRNDTEISTLCWEWVNDGGVLIAIGNHSIPFAYQDEDEKASYDRDGIVLGYHSIAYDGGESVSDSNFTEAYGLQYWSPYMGIDVDDVNRYGGTLVGYLYSGESDLVTIASIPIGEGRILAFGGNMGSAFQVNGEDVVASDLAKLLLAGAIFSTADPIYETRSLEKEGALGTIMVPKPFDGTLIALAFTNDDFNTLLKAETISI